MNRRLPWYLEKEGFLNSCQSGFPQHRSSRVRNIYIVHKQTEREKAYDITWRDNILRSLVNLGFTGNIAHYVNNFLQDRSFTVRINNTVSSVKMLQNGIPQGSVISVTLFLLTINNIFQKMSPPIEVHFFADDLVIFTRGKDLASMRNLMQSSLQDLDY